MLSKKHRFELSSRRRQVLILVVMEYTLGEAFGFIVPVGDILS